MDGHDPDRPEQLSGDALATLCQVSTAILGVAGFDGRLRWVNPAFSELFGHSREELLAMPDYLEMVHPDDRDAVVSLLGSLSAAGTGPAVDVRVRHSDGSWRWFRSATAVVGDLVYFSGFDLTEERRHAEDLGRANSSLRLFGMGVAHDLRGLLTVIEGAADQLVTSTREDPQNGDLDALSALLARSVKRAWVFIEALLAVARSEPLERDVVPLADIVAGAADDVAAERAAAGASIQWRPDLPAVWVNPVLIRATLANLFANSIRYCRVGVATRVVVEASQTGGTVTVSVTDNGQGIAAADLAAVFEPLARRSEAPSATSEVLTDRHAVPSGYGLGLALCRQVVEAHGGRVWAAAAPPGAGTTITMELPAASPAAR